MAYDLTKRLVIGLASSALFDLEESDTIFRNKGEKSYREFQKKMKIDHYQKVLLFLLSKDFYL